MYTCVCCETQFQFWLFGSIRFRRFARTQPDIYGKRNAKFISAHFNRKHLVPCDRMSQSFLYLFHDIRRSFILYFFFFFIRRVFPERDIRTAFTIFVQIYFGEVWRLGHINFRFRVRMLRHAG